MQVSTDLQASEVGEPIMLSLKLTGEGNFERIRGPELNDDSDWKIYAPEGQAWIRKPNRSAKRFDYVMIPKRVGTLKTPEVKFSFFDPANKEYIEYSPADPDPSLAQGAQQPVPPPRPSRQDGGASPPEELIARAHPRRGPPHTGIPRAGRTQNYVARTPSTVRHSSIHQCRPRGIECAYLSGEQTSRKLRTDPDYALQQASAGN